MKSFKIFLILLCAVLLSAGCLIAFADCGGDDDGDGNGAPKDDGNKNEDDKDDDDRMGKEEEKGEGIFSGGCPVEGKATATVIAGSEMRMEGPDAIGTEGDILIYNSRAAFIVENIEHRNAYYPYGGVLVDAAAVEGCGQASPEQFQELGFFAGALNISEYNLSIIRCFKGESLEIINDGSDGKAAVVRATGVDDYYWTVELQLIRDTAVSGNKKALSESFGLKIVIDYILEPDSNVLEIKATFTNESSEKRRITAAALIMFGDTAPVRYYSNTVLTVADYNLDQEVPWVAASRGDGAWAFAEGNANLAVVSIADITVLLNINRLLDEPITLSPAGEDGSSHTVTYYLSVGATDSNSATKHLWYYNAEPMPGKRYELVPIDGIVLDKISGEPLEGALVELQAKNTNNEWRILDSFYTDNLGKFSGEIPKFVRRQMEYRLVAHLKGRSSTEPVTVDPANPSSYTLEFSQGGTLQYDVRDENGDSIPAKILLWKNGEVAWRIYTTTGNGEELVVPGEYEYTVSRGYEYTTAAGNLTIKEGEETEISIELTHAVDTEGFLSFDGHCHAGPSPDNVISVPERIATVAAEGLDVVASTDHEFVGSWQWGIDETGLNDWVATVVGEEVTAPVPEHTNMYPVEPRFDINARGGYVEWYHLDIAEIYTAERGRGAKIVALNHPREYMYLIQYDPVAGKPQLNDPTMLGLKDDSALWDWNFNTIELMNGPEFIFPKPDNPIRSGLFEAWMSFLNFGYHITAVGVSDAHDYGIPGMPRSYFVSSSDSVAEFNEDELVTAMIEGRVLLSNGAFARLAVNGDGEMGDLVADGDGEVELSVHIEAIPEVDVKYFKVYLNCDQILNIPASAPDEVVKYSGELQVAVERDSHIVVMGFGENEIPRAFNRYNPYGTPRFVTNPIYIDYDGNGKFDPPGGKTCAYDLDAP
ncbi:MAG: hypothetical protein Kow0090_08740 [Myxococcota bacterium]